ncbi:hypothetical protein VSH64_20050 [Amycolatopsis rhabdoformis]|uniref:Uncharacterized protein n=1 Tax=Amycolatopsis rhabdoformis TaxID=1448059 RepID=A0ABZ1IJD7_9PSEU|nr:hypothetical protein [Amycolatopsis rhabdoformis]WSE34357.1 hypothetical protein VSH64_20050 [Amycolatopsis rhabdoformis]
MLYIVLVLVVAALALLVTALITASSLWAWVSIGLSVLAGLILLVDWLRRRNRPEAAEAEPAVVKAEKSEAFDAEQTALLPSTGVLGDPAEVPEPEIEPEPEAAAEASKPVDAAQPVEADADAARTQQPEADTSTTPDATEAAATSGTAAAGAAAAGASLAAETAGTTDEPAAATTDKTPPVRETPPAEEETSPEDLAVVKELEDEVVVVDEYPRYHLVDCAWLSGRDPIPIGVGEARQLGFTPCARCGPDAVLAAAHR